MKIYSRGDLAVDLIGLTTTLVCTVQPDQSHLSCSATGNRSLTLDVTAGSWISSPAKTKPSETARGSPARVENPRTGNPPKPLDWETGTTGTLRVRKNRPSLESPSCSLLLQ